MIVTNDLVRTTAKRKMTEALGDRIVSYGVLLYKKDGINKERRFLLGLIPQRNWWTVFKGMPSSKNESPTETALREFEEETGTSGIVEKITPEKTLMGKAGKKDLVIFLQEGSEFDVESFDIEKVVKIDSGYMQGQPEIVAIQWLTLKQALEGVDGAKIYKSQENILCGAHEFIMLQNN